jgi:hypothetical protein
MYLQSWRIGSDNSYCQVSRDQAQAQNLKLAIAWQQTSAKKRTKENGNVYYKINGWQRMCCWSNSSNNVPAR